MTDPATLSLEDLQSFDPNARHREGRESRFLCPFCGEGKKRDTSHRSLAVGPDGQWHCHRCKASGLLTEYRTTMPPKSYTRPRAYQPVKTTTQPRPDDAPKTYDINAEYKKLTPVEGTLAEVYLKGRGISLQTAESGQVKFTPGVTFKPEGKLEFTTGPGIAFPLRSVESLELVGMSVRMIRTADKWTLKAKDVPCIYATSLDVFERRGVPAVVTEAPIDALSITEASMADVIATVGTAFPEPLAWKLIGRTVYLGHDNDEPDANGIRPGDAAASRAAALLDAEGCYCLRLRPTRKDWNEDLQADREALRAGLLPILGDPFE